MPILIAQLDANGRKTRQRQPAKTRERLIKAAMQVISEKGFSGASADEIVKRAALTNGALYAHFSSKNELLVTAIREQTQSLEAVIDEQIKSAHQPIDKLKAVTSSWHRFSPPDGGIIVETITRARQDEAVRAILRERLNRVETVYAQWIREGQLAQTIRPDVDPEAFSRVLSAIGTGYQCQISAGIDKVSDRSWIETLTLLLNSLLVSPVNAAPDGR